MHLTTLVGTWPAVYARERTDSEDFKLPAVWVCLSNHGSDMVLAALPQDILTKSNRSLD